jgi:hypothetical protein
VIADQLSRHNYHDFLFALADAKSRIDDALRAPDASAGRRAIAAAKEQLGIADTRLSGKGTPPS